MSFALFVCAVTLFLVISVFGQSLIKPLTVPLDGAGTEGKVIVSSADGILSESKLDELAAITGAGYYQCVQTIKYYACIFNGKVFSYSYWDRTIVNYDELEAELEEYMKTVKKDGRHPAGIER